MGHSTSSPGALGCEQAQKSHLLVLARQGAFTHNNIYFSKMLKEPLTAEAEDKDVKYEVMGQEKVSDFAF